jgi:hypothetical protein
MRDAAAFECERICGRDHLAPPVRAQSRARRRNPATVESAKRVQISARRQHAHSHSPACPLRGLTGARGTWLQSRPGVPPIGSAARPRTTDDAPECRPEAELHGVKAS